MIYSTLLSIFALFLFFALIINPLSRRFLKRNVCAVCAAVSITWIVLLALDYFGYSTDKLLTGILMGESITGLMYLFEGYATKKNKSLLVLKIFIILLGTLIAYTILK